MTLGSWVAGLLRRLVGIFLSVLFKFRWGIFLGFSAGVVWSLWLGFWNPADFSTWFDPNFVRPTDLGATGMVEIQKILVSATWFWGSNWIRNLILIAAGGLLDAILRFLSRIKVGK